VARRRDARRSRAIHAREAQDFRHPPPGPRRQRGDRGDRFGNRRLASRPRGRRDEALRRGWRAREAARARHWHGGRPSPAPARASRRLAVHASSTTAATAESTTFNILKGINWSVQEGARIINMSFAGPRDPSLERALKATYDKGIVLIAAAGNAGPKSPPL